jgi:ATP-dependent Clp protease ATP-binding subunit ClpC
LDNAEEFPDEELPEPEPEVDLARMTEAARRALDAASETARGRGDSFVGSDHLLLGLALTGGCAAARLLATLDFSTKRIQTELSFILGAPNGDVPVEDQQPYSPRLQRVIEFAAKECAKRRHPEITTLHLLSGLLRERTGIASVVLEAPGVGHGRAGSAILLAFREGWTDDPVP